MSKKLQLTIAEPCHENWENMSPVDKGKFCGSCQKQVIDFSDMSDRQVAEFFKKPSTGSVCGRFMTDQLDRDIEIPRKRIPWVKYFFQFALPAFLLSIKASAQKTQGKIKVNTVSADTTRRPVFAEQNRTLGLVIRPDNFKPFIGDTIVTPIKEPVVMMKGDIKIAVDTAVIEPVCSREIMGAISIPVRVNKNEIEGIVVNEDNQPVPYASIETGKPGEGLMTDENGYFRIKKIWLSKGKALVFSSTGFENRKIVAGWEQYAAGKLFVQLKTNGTLPEVVVTAMSLTRKGRVVMGYSTIKCQTVVTVQKDSVMNTEIKLQAEETNLLIYPNPVSSGSSVNLSFKQLDEGYYQLQVINQSGQIMEKKEIWIDAEATVLNIDIPSVAAGSYFLVFINKKTGKKFTEKIIVQ